MLTDLPPETSTDARRSDKHAVALAPPDAASQQRRLWSTQQGPMIADQRTTKARYRLHCVDGSGNSFEVALFLNCAGLDWEPVGVDLAGGQNGAPARRAAANAMGEVPVLEVDGRRMNPSGAILMWLAWAHGAFGPAAARRRHSRRCAGCCSTTTNSPAALPCTPISSRRCRSRIQPYSSK